MKITDYDIIIVGAGHAGTEAALYAARMLKKGKVLLLTHNIETIGTLSCNPSLGSQGRSSVLLDLCSTGSKILLAADYSSMQTKVLGKSNGPAMWATRSQLDRQLFKMNVRKIVESQSNLDVFQQEVEDIILEGGNAVGVRTKLGIEFMAQAIILTTGTFLNGKLHVGLQNQSGGRAGDPASVSLAARLKELKMPMGRLKTGTPPRIDGRSIDYSKLVAEYGDGHETGDYAVFSQFGHKSMHPTQKPNWITRTNAKTHDIFRSAFDESPMFNKNIEDGITGNGPRYCMSLETKIDRFSDRDSHQIVLEPEGLNVHEYYPNGISTSLPFHAQYAAIRSIEGLEKAHITTPGYAVEYDYYHGTSFKRTLECKSVENLFFAGSILGTSGYSEAMAMGAVAGINAAQKVLNLEPWVPARHESYIGVLVDDVTTKEDLFEEPYRLFTAKAEYRLSLRQDNSDQRMTPMGRKLGLVGDKQWELFNIKQESIAKYAEKLKSSWVNPKILDSITAQKELGSELGHEYNLAELLKRPNVNLENIQRVAKAAGLDESLQAEAMVKEMGEDLAKKVVEQIEITTKYSGYIDAQKIEIERMKNSENTKLPETLDYDSMAGLSVEVKQKLNKHRPETLGQASRISGVSPAAISILMVYLKKSDYKSSIKM